MKLYKIILIAGVILAGIIGTAVLSQQPKSNAPALTNNQSSTLTKQDLLPVDAITHGHGLAVDNSDPNKVYIATHHGLLVLINEKDLFQIGSTKDDYMGFIPHPTDPKIFFSSGHPASGGNIGFQKSDDGGFTWKKVSDGIQGPVDFHAMAVSPSNPKLIYGWYKGMLQRSIDEGKTWEVASTTSYPIVNLSVDPVDENIIYAATPQGLLVSKNKGAEWSILIDGFVSVVAINPQDSQILLSFSEKNGLARSTDGGTTWRKLTEAFNSETPLFIAFNKQDSEKAYTLTEKNSMYKSFDGGESWNKIL